MLWSVIKTATAAKLGNVSGNIQRNRFKMKYSKIIILILSIISCEIYSQEKIVAKYDNGNIMFEGYAKNNILHKLYSTKKRDICRNPGNFL